jgi:hypothetical protein
MIPVQITDWNIYLLHGEQFLKTAGEAYKKQKPTFTTEAIYNLTCMAIEKLIMAFLMKHGDLADNHTMADLLHSMERHIAIDEDLDRRLRHLDTFQQICDLDGFSILKPSSEDLQCVVETAYDLRRFLLPHLHRKQHINSNELPYSL